MYSYDQRKTKEKNVTHNVETFINMIPINTVPDDDCWESNILLMIISEK